MQFKSTLVLATAFLGFASTAHSKELIQCSARMYIAAESEKPDKVKFKVVLDEKNGSSLQIGSNPAQPILSVTSVKITNKDLIRVNACDLKSEAYDVCVEGVLKNKSYFERGPVMALSLMSAYANDDLAPAAVDGAVSATGKAELVAIDQGMAAEKKIKFDLSQMASARMFHIVPEDQSQFGGGGLIEYFDAKGVLLGRLVQAIEVSTCK